MIKFDHVWIGRGAHIRPGSSLEGYNRVRDYAYLKGELGYASYIGTGAEVIGSVGRFTSIGDNVCFITKTHPVRGFVSTHPAFYSTKKQAGFTFAKESLFDEEPTYSGSDYPIIVGSDVYIGYGALIIGPCKIGDGAVIAAGAVVTGDVEPYAIMGGNPARLIRYRFEQEDREWLTDTIRWWEKEVDWIRDRAGYYTDLESLKEHITL